LERMGEPRAGRHRRVLGRLADSVRAVKLQPRATPNRRPMP
jgi:hypothetical protein